MGRYLLFLAVSSGLCFANSKSWVENFVAEGCGQSNASALKRAKKAAVDAGKEYADICQDEGGVSTEKYTYGYCDYDGTNLSCPAVCAVYGKVRCDI